MADIINIALITFAVLALAATAGLFTEKAGIANIAINGMMIFGALGYSIVSNFAHPFLGDFAFVAGIFGAIIFGLLIGLLFGFLTIPMKSDHIISGTAINLIAPAMSVAAIKFIYDGSFIKVEQGTIFTIGGIYGYSIIFAALTVGAII
jgi:simple sugar transport system permease protein